MHLKVTIYSGADNPAGPGEKKGLKQLVYKELQGRCCRIESAYQIDGRLFQADGFTFNDDLSAFLASDL